ncbi:hypothetical protein C6497_10840 [Candidatus Poribacteria bacterium]|nr:MAG: hypothetical protein C6497_10840 [Candidatus Poribacteria bacterium]
MRKITKADPIVSSTRKPSFPWLIATSTLVVVLIMLGIGSNKNLALFQHVHQQVENNNPQPENPVPNLQHDNAQLPSAEIGEKNNMENYPQWHLPKEAKMRLGKGGLGTIHFSPDGSQLAVGSRIGVWHYDVKTGEEISLIPNMYGAIAYSPDGRFIASGGGDPITSLGGSHLEKGVVLWNVATASEVPVKEELPPASVIRFSNDSKILVFLSMSRETIYRVNVETGETTTTKLDERPGYLHREDYALTEDKIAIGSDDGRIELWDTTTGTKLSTLREFGKEIQMPNYFVENNRALTMKFTPDGTRLATGNLDTSVQLWDTSTGEELIVFQKPIEGNMWSISPENGKEIVNNPMKDETLSRPTVLAFSPDGTLLACGSEDSTIKLWNAVTGELRATFTGHLDAVGPLVFSPDGKTLASASGDGTVRFWDINSREALNNKIVGHMWQRTTSMLDDSSKFTSVSSNGIITLWDLENLQKSTIQTKATLEEPLYWGMYRHYVLSPDGTILANQGRQSNPSKPDFNSDVFRLTDVSTGHELKIFPEGRGSVFSPDGKTIAGWGGNKIHLLNVETGEMSEIIIAEESDEHTPTLNVFAFSPDGKIVTGTDGGLVQMWDPKTGIQLSSFLQEQPPIDGRYQDPITNFAFSSDGSLLAVGSRKKIRLLGSPNLPHFDEVLYANQNFSDNMLFSPDNTILIVGFWSGKIELWDVPTGDLLTILDGHSLSIDDMKFSQDNKTLVSGGDGTILLWDWEKIRRSVRGDNQEHQHNKNGSTREKVIQFIEDSSQPAKSTDHVLTKGEVYLANEWYDVALEEFTRYLTAADYRDKIDQNITTSPKFQRELFEKISKAGKDIHDKEGFVEMVSKLIELIPDNLSIQVNGHIVLAKFFHHNGMLEKMEEQNQKIHSITANLHTQSFRLRLNIYLSLVNYYHGIELPEERETHIQMINDMIAELDPNQSYPLKLQLEANFGLADFYNDQDLPEKAAEQIQKTGFVTEDAWMVLGPFDNAGAIGYNTPYIPEDMTEIDLTRQYDGLDGPVSWKRFTDAKLDGYIHLGEKNADWQVSYAFATVTSPDTRKVQFRFDSDDQGKLWLNGKEEFTHTKAFAARIDTYTIPVTLNPGKNTVLVKVCNEMGGWAFYLRITDNNGQPFDDLKINRKIQNKD